MTLNDLLVLALMAAAPVAIWDYIWSRQMLGATLTLAVGFVAFAVVIVAAVTLYGLPIYF